MVVIFVGMAMYVVADRLAAQKRAITGGDAGTDAGTERTSEEWNMALAQVGFKPYYWYPVLKSHSQPATPEKMFAVPMRPGVIFAADKTDPPSSGEQLGKMLQYLYPLSDEEIHQTPPESRLWCMWRVGKTPLWGEFLPREFDGARLGRRLDEFRDAVRKIDSEARVSAVVKHSAAAGPPYYA